MKKFILITFITFFINYIGYSQDTIYYNSNWEISTNKNFNYYRVISPKHNKFQIEDYYSSGQIQMVGLSKSKDSLIKEGVYEYFLENGTKSKNITYKNNLKNGEFKLYHDSGNLKEKGFYKNDKLTNKNIQYFENGIISREAEFKKGTYHGNMTYYNDAGILIGNGKTKNDEWDGKWTQFDDSGKKISEIIYGNTFKIKEAKIKLISDNYVWSLFEKKEYPDYEKYFMRCVSTIEKRKNFLSNPPEVNLVIIKDKNVFDNFYLGITKKEIITSTFNNETITLMDSFVTEYQNQGKQESSIVFEFKNHELYFIIESPIDENNKIRNQKIIENLINNIQSY